MESNLKSWKECDMINMSFRYQSQFAKNVRDEFRKNKYEHHTMGEANTHLPPPEDFLRKKARDNQFYRRVKSARAHSKYLF